MLLVVTDGRRPGYSVGMTNFELAQTLVRLGAVTGSALDGGGSSTLAFDGTLLNRPSDRGGERPVSNSLQLMYYGVYAPAPDPVISPNGDGFDETQRQLSYKVVRPSDVTATLVGPDGAPPSPRPWSSSPGRTRSPSRRRRSTHCRADAAGRGPLAARGDGDRRPRARLDDDTDLHRQQHARLREALAPLARRARARQADDHGGVTLTRPARLTATVETTSGVQVATIAIRRLPAGRFVASWSGTTRGGKFLVYGGIYVVRFRATNELGAVERRQHPVPRHPRGADAGQEAEAEGVTSARCRSPRSCRRSPTSSRPSSATTGSTRSSC